MGEIVIKLFKYLITQVRLPRIAWVFIVGGILFCLSMFGVKIYQSDEILVNATDKFQLAVNVHEKAHQVKDQAHELHKQAQQEREEMREEINQRLNEVIELLDDLKWKVHHERTRADIRLMPPERLKELIQSNEKVTDRISAAQMDLKGFRASWAKKTGIRK